MKPIATWMPQRQAEDDQDHHADDADRGVLAVEVGAGALLDGGGNLLHAGGAGVGRQHLLAGDQTVDQRQQTADDDHVLGQLHPGLSSYGRIVCGRAATATARARPGSVGAAVCQIGEQVANRRSSMSVPYACAGAPVSGRSGGCACSSTGQSGRLITAWLQVRVLPGAPSACPKSILQAGELASSLRTDR